jgi:2-(1,2-epoxy-1,2-dihydrophenyl)acetyl-CoA isomerase
VILAAEGSSFSTGGDLLGFWQQRDNIADYAHALVGLLNEAILAIYTHPAPIACAVHGQVTGGSLGLLLAADHVVVQPGVSITPWYSEVGFSPDGGWTALLPDIVGRQRSSHWLSTNASVDAEDCVRIGVAHELATDGALDAALRWSHAVAGLSAASIRATRALLGQSVAELGQRLEAERSAFVHHIQTPEAIAGIARFLGKKHCEEAL